MAITAMTRQARALLIGAVVINVISRSTSLSYWGGEWHSFIIEPLFNIVLLGLIAISPRLAIVGLFASLGLNLPPIGPWWLQCIVWALSLAALALTAAAAKIILHEENRRGRRQGTPAMAWVLLVVWGAISFLAFIYGSQARVQDPLIGNRAIAVWHYALISCILFAGPAALVIGLTRKTQQRFASRRSDSTQKTV